jgi:hypothetical protein
VALAGPDSTLPNEITVMLDSNDPASAPPTATAPTSGQAGEATSGPPGSSGVGPADTLETRAYVLALFVGLAAGLVAWAIGETLLVPESLMGHRGGNSPTSLAEVGTRNAMVSFGILGAAMGSGLGLVGGAIRRSFVATVIAGLTGLVLGGAVGATSARLILPIYYANIRTTDLTYSLMVHGGIWVPLGAAAGLAFAVGRGGRGRMTLGLMGGIAGALLATVTYEFAGIWLFPQAMMDRPVSASWQSRLMARIIVATLVAAGAVLSANKVASIGARETGKVKM